MMSILFVCTGNIFRSVAAEYALKAALGQDGRYRVGSAGIAATPQPMHPLIHARLRDKGADPSRHVQRRLTEALLDSTDVLIAMGLDHREFIRRRFGREALLFNQLCHGVEESVLDIHEAVPDFARNLDAAFAYAARAIDHIWDSAPLLARHLDTSSGSPPEHGQRPSVRRAHPHDVAD